MSHTEPTKESIEAAGKAAADVRQKFVEAFVAQHGETMGAALEVFGRTSAMVKAINSILNESGAPPEIAKSIMDILVTHSEFMLNTYFKSLQLSNDSVKTAAESSELMTEKMRAAFYGTSVQ